MTINRKTSLTGYQLRTGLKAAKGGIYYHKKPATEWDTLVLTPDGCKNVCYPDAVYKVEYGADPKNNQCYCFKS